MSATREAEVQAFLDRVDRAVVLGNSLGAATGLSEAVGDDRVDALVLDSLHTRLRYQIEARVVRKHFEARVWRAVETCVGAKVDVQRPDGVR